MHDFRTHLSSSPSRIGGVMLWLVMIMAASTTQVTSQSRHAAGIPRPAPAGITAFVDVTVIPMDKEHLISNQTVLIQDTRITAIGPVGKIAVPAGAMRIDGRGKFLIPGLGDMHAHLANITGMFGGRSDSDSIVAERRLLLYALNGVTTIRNLDYLSRKDGDLALRLRARATLEETGTIAVAKRADLVLLTGNPLEDIQRTMHPAGVMLGGRWLSRQDIEQQLAALIGKVS